ncbi:MAG: hypothetical protein Q9202_002128 [Teloschistes flavicans]
MPEYNGRCHCGQTEWTVKLDDPSHILCESTMNTIASKNDLKITKGSFKSYDYQGDSGNPVHCYYCPNCTSHAYHHQTVLGPDKIIVRTALLRGGKDFKVAAEIFGKDRLGWQPEVAHTFEGPPPS